MVPPQRSCPCGFEGSCLSAAGEVKTSELAAPMGSQRDNAPMALPVDGGE